MSQHRFMFILALALGFGCTPSDTPAPLETPCEVEVVNRSDGAMDVTAFGRTIMELGTVGPEDSARFSELCRVERVSVRGVPVGGGDAIWIVAIMRVGGVVSVDLGT